MAERTSQEFGRTGAPAPGTTAPSRQGRGLAFGLTVFAMCVMLITGLFQVLLGLAAIIHRTFYVVTTDYAYEFTVTGWGWLHLISGLVVVAAACALLTGRVWARLVGIAVVSLSAIENFFFIPYYPAWTILIIALDVLVIWALATYRHDGETTAAGYR
ncbi:hypothetical protein NKH77_27565 [Streptomyces sp. M19]